MTVIDDADTTHHKVAPTIRYHKIVAVAVEFKIVTGDVATRNKYRSVGHHSLQPLVSYHQPTEGTRIEKS